MTDDRFVFIHIPKTAGTSFRTLLYDIFDETRVSPPFSGAPLTDEDARKLDSYQVIAGHISWADVKRYFPRRRLITFLRDPIERCLSVYGFFRQQRHHPLIPLNQIRNVNDPYEATSLARQLTPEDFFHSAHPHVLQNISNRMVWQLGSHAAFERRNGMGEDDALRAAADHLAQCDFVGTVERIDESVSQFSKRFGDGRGRARLQHLNVTESPMIRSDLSKGLYDYLVSLNALDLKLYRANENASAELDFKSTLRAS